MRVPLKNAAADAVFFTRATAAGFFDAHYVDKNTVGVGHVGDRCNARNERNTMVLPVSIKLRFRQNVHPFGRVGTGP
jgi:hypothetical protein